MEKVRQLVLTDDDRSKGTPEDQIKLDDHASTSKQILRHYLLVSSTQTVHARVTTTEAYWIVLVDFLASPTPKTGSGDFHEPEYIQQLLIETVAMGSSKSESDFKK